MAHSEAWRRLFLAAVADWRQIVVPALTSKGLDPKARRDLLSSFLRTYALLGDHWPLRAALGVREDLDPESRVALKLPYRSIPGGRLRRTEIAPFEMREVEVAAWEYEHCVAEGSCRALYGSVGLRGDCTYLVPTRSSHPINCVEWREAEAYCAWEGGRLPTTMEWEWAARGATNGRTYPWGESQPSCELAIMVGEDGIPGCGRKRPWAVGSRPRGASAHGLRDLVGNVSEWIGYGGPVEFDDRHIKGGAWDTLSPAVLRADSTEIIGHNARRDRPSIGFRCVRSHR